MSSACQGTYARKGQAIGTSWLGRTSQQHSGISRSQFVQLSLILSFPSELHAEMFALQQQFMDTVGFGET